ncbi:FLX-like 1-like protein [Drosera capensis]
MAGRNHVPPAHAQLLEIREVAVQRGYLPPPPPPPLSHILVQDPRLRGAPDRIAAAHKREIQTLLHDSQHLAATRRALEQDLSLAQQELRHLAASAHEVKNDRTAELRLVYERSLKLEADVQAIEAHKAELREVRLDVEKLTVINQDLTTKLETVNADFAKAKSELKDFPAIKDEIEAMQQELRKGRGTSDSQIDPSDELFLHHSDHTNFSLSHKLLDGDNYNHWKRSVEVSLLTKNKLGLVRGSWKCPKSDSPQYLQWNRCNSIVISWLLYSGSPSVPDYFTKINRLWDAQGTMMQIPPYTSGSSKEFTEILQNQKLMQFFMGLNDFYRNVRGDAASFMSNQRNMSYGNKDMGQGQGKNASGSVHGYPPGHKFYKEKRVAVNVTHENVGGENVDPNLKSGENAAGESCMISQEQYGNLMALLSKISAQDNQIIHTSMMANYSHGLNHNWIIDSGASDHITPNLSLFHTYDPMVDGTYITMPNGGQAKVTHKGTVVLSPDLILENVLHVPAFHFNLLSTSQLTKQLLASLIFDSRSCILQGPSMKRSFVLDKATRGFP